jgi:hypothetical protein
VPEVLGLGVCQGERSGIELRDDVLRDMGYSLLQGGSNTIGLVVVVLVVVNMSSDTTIEFGFHFVHLIQV